MLKRKIGILLCLVLILICAFALADVKINRGNFPDDEFRTYVAQFDTDGNEKLSDAELAAVKTIDVSKDWDATEGRISSLKGIEHFTALTTLKCSSNSVSTLDVSSNTALTVLECANNMLTELDVSSNTALKELRCYVNQLTALDVSKNPLLTALYCDNNNLTALDLSSNKALGHIDCSNNKITALDVGGNTVLQGLNCQDNQLATLNLANTTELVELACFGNQLAALDLSQSVNLERLFCHGNQLTALDVSKNTELVKLQCYSNKLQKLDVSKVPALSDLVKETDPKEKSGYLAWERDDDGDGTLDQLLYVDQGVKVLMEQTFDLSTAEVGAIKDRVYTGKPIQPAVTVRYGEKVLTKGTDYTVSYKNNKKVGTAKVIITGKGIYTGSQTATFRIIPKSTKLISLTAGKNQLLVKWKKGSGITGYQIQYSTSKNFKVSKKVTIKDAATTAKVLKKLLAKKTYYVRIRTYKTVSGEKYYSKWSAYLYKKTK